jgi:hypothetical protein
VQASASRGFGQVLEMCVAFPRQFVLEGMSKSIDAAATTWIQILAGVGRIALPIEHDVHGLPFGFHSPDSSTSEILAEAHSFQNSLPAVPCRY